MIVGAFLFNALMLRGPIAARAVPGSGEKGGGALVWGAYYCAQPPRFTFAPSYNYGS